MCTYEDALQAEGVRYFRIHDPLAAAGTACTHQEASASACTAGLKVEWAYHVSTMSTPRILLRLSFLPWAAILGKGKECHDSLC